jgi:cytochrome c-type biogenesis protein CcmE
MTFAFSAAGEAISFFLLPEELEGKKKDLAKHGNIGVLKHNGVLHKKTTNNFT